MKKLGLLLFIILYASQMKAQSFDNYQWKNRLVVVFADTTSNNRHRKQLEILKEEKAGFKERKLQLILALPGKYREIFPESSGWIQDPDLYKYRRLASEEFEVILIGLDGGVKKRQLFVLTAEKLFEEIDSMPMRQAEIKENG